MLGMTNYVKCIVINRFGAFNFGRNQYGTFIYSNIDKVSNLIGKINATFLDNITYTIYKPYKIINNRLSPLNKNDSIDRKSTTYLIHRGIILDANRIYELIVDQIKTRSGIDGRLAYQLPSIGIFPSYTDDSLILPAPEPTTVTITQQDNTFSYTLNDVESIAESLRKLRADRLISLRNDQSVTSSDFKNDEGATEETIDTALNEIKKNRTPCQITLDNLSNKLSEKLSDGSVKLKSLTLRRSSHFGPLKIYYPDLTNISLSGKEVDPEEERCIIKNTYGKPNAEIPKNSDPWKKIIPSKFGLPNAQAGLMRISYGY